MLAHFVMHLMCNFVFYNCSAVLHLAETLEIAFSEVSSDNLPPESDNTSCYWGGF